MKIQQSNFRQDKAFKKSSTSGLLIEFDDDGFFKSASLNGEEKTMEWLDEHNERSYWDVGLRGIEQ